MVYGVDTSICEGAHGNVSVQMRFVTYVTVLQLVGQAVAAG